MITYHGYNNGDPMYNTHKSMGPHYTWQNMVNYFLFEIAKVIFPESSFMSEINVASLTLCVYLPFGYGYK